MRLTDYTGIDTPEKARQAARLQLGRKERTKRKGLTVDEWDYVEWEGHWIWIWVVEPAGYGVICVTTDGKRNLYKAHREFHDIPEGMESRHQCQYRSCVFHIIPGTDRENMIDRGRFLDMGFVDRRVNLKVDQMQHDLMIAMRGAGWYYKDIAAVFGVTRRCAEHHIKGRTGSWRNS